MQQVAGSGSRSADSLDIAVSADLKSCLSRRDKYINRCMWIGGIATPILLVTPGLIRNSIKKTNGDTGGVADAFLFLIEIFVGIPVGIGGGWLVGHAYAPVCANSP